MIPTYYFHHHLIYNRTTTFVSNTPYINSLKKEVRKFRSNVFFP